MDLELEYAAPLASIDFITNSEEEYNPSDFKCEAYNRDTNIPIPSLDLTVQITKDANNITHICLVPQGSSISSIILYHLKYKGCQQFTFRLYPYNI